MKKRINPQLRPAIVVTPKINNGPKVGLIGVVDTKVSVDIFSLMKSCGNAGTAFNLKKGAYLK